MLSAHFSFDAMLLSGSKRLSSENKRFVKLRFLLFVLDLLIYLVYPYSLSTIVWFGTEGFFYFFFNLCIIPLIEAYATPKHITPITQRKIQKTTPTTSDNSRL